MRPVNASVHLRRIIISAMFLSLALILRTYLRVDLYMFGGSGMRLSVHGIFSTMPSILFGPVYGGIVSGLTDFLGFLMRPAGAYLPMLTVTAVAAGFLRGCLWLFLRNKNAMVMRYCLGAVAAVVLFVGGYNMFAFRADGVRDFYSFSEESGIVRHVYTHTTEGINADGLNYYRISEYTSIERRNDVGNITWHMEGVRTIIYTPVATPPRRIDADASYVNITGMRLISRMAIVRSFATLGQANVLGEFIMFTTGAMIGSGALVLLLLALDFVLRKFLLKDNFRTMALALSMMIPAILVSTANTWILRETTMTAWQVLPFYVVWLPRVLQSIGTTTINVYFVAVLINVCESQPTMRALMAKVM
ncbi:MAG: ECF transporter S component [Defluviitaleaceae bacterium]|nr:ECF transporter S component [Defluviitaleaceae bacterium]